MCACNENPETCVDASAVVPTEGTRDAVAAEEKAAASSRDRRERRLQRIADLLDEALAHPVAAVSLVGGVNADLAQLELRLYESVNAVLAAGQGAEDDDVPLGLETILKLGRQIERGVRLADELARRAERPASIPRPREVTP